ncbi:MAG: helix-turn-helix transcriptional regulator [Anaerolineales bacterium]
MSKHVIFLRYTKTMSGVATRLLSMIFLFQSRRQWTVSELSDELDVSDRTVHRYIGMLEEMGIPLYSERGPYGGFSLLRTYKLPPLIFTPQEATVLYMGARLVEDIWGKPFQNAVTGVTAKLDNVLPDDMRQEVQRAQRNLVVMMGTARDYATFHDLMTTLRVCMASSQRVKLIYHSFSRIETERKVDPYALSLRWGNWYLIGYCHMRKEMRTFRVDRINNLQPIKEYFEFPHNFDAKTYLEESMRWEYQYQVVVWMAPEVAAEMRERASDWMRVSDNPDGSVTVRFEVENFNWATGWVLSWGRLAKALEPPELIERIRESAQELLKQYEDEP